MDKAIAETIDQAPDPQAKRERLFSIGGAGDEYPTDGNPHGVLSNSAVEITFTPPTSLGTLTDPLSVNIRDVTLDCVTESILDVFRRRQSRGNSG